MPLWFLFILLC